MIEHRRAGAGDAMAGGDLRIDLTDRRPGLDQRSSDVKGDRLDGAGTHRVEPEKVGGKRMFSSLARKANLSEASSINLEVGLPAP